MSKKRVRAKIDLVVQDTWTVVDGMFLIKESRDKKSILDNVCFSYVQ